MKREKGSKIERKIIIKN